MMDDMAEAKRIAAGLSKAQRGAIMRAAAPPSAAKPFYIPIFRDGGEIARALRAQRLARLFDRGRSDLLRPTAAHRTIAARISRAIRGLCRQIERGS